MSIEAMSWVMNHSEQTLSHRLVLLALADHANADGTGAWPSVDTLAEMAHLSRRQVQRCLKDLEEDGAIRREGDSDEGFEKFLLEMGV